MKKHFNLLFVALTSFSLLSCNNSTSTTLPSSTPSSSPSSITPSSTLPIITTYQITYNSNYDIDGPTLVNKNETLTFKVNYINTYKNHAIQVFANGIKILGDNYNFTIENIDKDYLIEVKEVVKDNYDFIFPVSSLYEIYTDQTTILDDNSFSFVVRFWGDTYLDEVKIKVNDEIIYPDSFDGTYIKSVKYNFTITNVKQDIKVSVEDIQMYTWYEYYSFSNIRFNYEYSINATLQDIPVRLGYTFVGWTLVLDDLSTLITLPYKNTTTSKILPLYAYYSLNKESLKLPVIEINTTNFENIERETYSTASFKLLDNNEEINANCSIRVRGNSTAKYEKKPYKIKFNSSQAFYGSDKFKDWVLLADYLDPSLMKNYLALSMSNALDTTEFKFTLKHVEVYVNNVYQGVYLLTDQVEENDHGRVNIEVPTLDEEVVPFLLERDKDGEGILGVNYFTLGISNFIIKYPENPTQKQFNYIYNYVLDIYKNIKTNNITELSKSLDLESLIDYCVLNELMVNIDSNWKSGFLYKGLNEKVKFGPVWDFDWSLTTWNSHPCTDKEFTLKDKYFLLKRDPSDFSFDWLIYLVQNKDIFDTVVDSWDNIKNIYLTTMSTYDEYYLTFKDAGLRNYETWYKKDYEEGGKANYVPDVNLFVDQYNFVKKALNIRYESLNQSLNKDNHQEFINPEFNFISK